MTELAVPASTEQPADPAVRRRVLSIVFATVFLDMIGFGIVIPRLPLYVTGMHAAPIFVGVLISTFSAMQLIATPILGKLSDRYGRRRIIVLSLAGNALSMVIFALALRLSLLWLLFVSRILAGATAGNLSACQAAIADVSDKKDRAGAMGMLGAGIGLGMVLGPALGGLVNRLGPAGPPLAAAAMALLDLVFVLAMMPETRRSLPASDAEARTPRPSLGAVLSERRMATVLLLYFLIFIGMSNLQASFTLLIKERVGWEPDAFFVVFGAIALVVQAALVGRLARAFGEIRLVIAGASLTGAGMVVIGVAHSLAPLFAGVVLLSFGTAITNPSLSALASKLARGDQQGAVLGFAQSAGGLGRTIGPTWSSFLYGSVSSTMPFLSGAAAALFSLILGLSLQASVPAAAPGEAAPPAR
jgi:MFS family permease